MSGSSANLSPFTLGDTEKGRPKGLHKYWRNKITVPASYDPLDDDDDDFEDAADGDDEDEDPSKKATATKAPASGAKGSGAPITPITATPLHSTMPSELEYELRESVALSSILINVADISGSGINPRGKSHQAWSLLEAQYGKASDRARNMREEALASCRMAEGGKVAGEDGHIEKMRTLRQRANEAGAKITDTRFITKLLDSFPPSWDAIIMPLYNETDLSKVIMNLQTHAERLEIRASKEKKPAPDSVKALEATVLALQAELKSFRNKSNSSNSDKVCSNTAKLVERKADSTCRGRCKYGNCQYVVYCSRNCDCRKSLCAVEQKVALVAAEHPGIATPGACVADSGCSAFFFKDRAAFKEYRSIDGAGQSSKAGATFAVVGIGLVELKVVHNRKEHTLRFSDAFHAPDVTANLISISKLDLAGWEVVFGGQRVRFLSKKQEVFIGECTVTPESIGFSNMASTLCSFRSDSHHGGCKTSRRAQDCRGRGSNIDIWGPARVTSAGGAKYGMKFHDDASSHRRTFFLSNREAETTLEALVIDNAGEFTGDVWDAFMKTHGLKFIPTPPYSSSANGTAERSIGVTTGAVRAMLRDAGLAAKYWAEAWAYADVVENLLPSARHPGVIPEEKWTGQKQDVGHLRVWGCVAYVLIPSEKGGSKLDDRAQKGRLMGIEGRGVYRVLIPETGQIIRSRNVQFEEGTGHRTLTAEGEYFADDDDDHDLNFLLDNNSNGTTIPSLENITPVTDSSAATSSGNSLATNSANNPAPKVTRPRIVYPPASRKSSRLAAAAAKPNSDPEMVSEDITIPIFEDPEEEIIELALSAEIAPEPLNRFIPQSFEEAFDLSRRHLWLPPMKKEIDRWDDRGVVTPVPRPDGIKTIKTKWVFDEKVDGSGNLLKRRGRCVVKGFTQKLGEHYWESFAAVVRYESIRMMFALAAAKGMKAHLIDVVGAFLNAKPQGKNYLEIPEGFESHYSIPGVDTVLEMNLNLYGTMDGANNWFRLLNETYEELGHRRSKADSLTTSQLYPPLMLLKPRRSASFHPSLKSLIMDDLRSLLVWAYYSTLTATSCKPKYTPLPPSLNLAGSQPTPISESDKHFMRDKPYRSACGTFNHLANGTRPDIAFAVMVLMRYATDPRPIHWNLVRKGAIVKPVGYSDSSYADDALTRKSSAGYVFLSAGGAVGWKAKTQQRVSTSTGEAEYVGVYEGGRQAKWMTSWYFELDQYFDLPVTVHCDNEAALALAKNASGHSRVKHVEVKTHWIRDAVEHGEVHIEPISSEDNIADIFTKPLSQPKLERFIKMMGMEVLDV